MDIDAENLTSMAYTKLLARLKSGIVWLAQHGLLSRQLASWLIQRGGLKHV